MGHWNVILLFHLPVEIEGFRCSHPFNLLKFDISFTQYSFSLVLSEHFETKTVEKKIVKLNKWQLFLWNIWWRITHAWQIGPTLHRVYHRITFLNMSLAITLVPLVWFRWNLAYRLSLLVVLSWTTIFQVRTIEFVSCIWKKVWEKAMRIWITDEIKSTGEAISVFWVLNCDVKRPF